MNTQVQAIILAAGKSSRFNTGKSKLLEPICGRPMIVYSIKLFEALQIPMLVVVGYQKEEVQKAIQEATIKKNNFVSDFKHDPILYVAQEEQRGTGHAIMCTQDKWEKDNILVVNGDMPLITAAIIEDLVRMHYKTDAVISFITAHCEYVADSAYGRVVKTGDKIEIIEARNFVGDVSAHCFINAGIYLLKRNFLDSYIHTLKPNPVTQELYFTDLIKIASDAGLVVTAVSVPFDNVRGINTLQELWAAEQIKRSDIIKHWMDNGVRFSAPQSIHIDNTVTIEAGVFIGNGVHLKKATRIGKNSIIDAFSILDNATIGDNVTVFSHSVISDSHIKDNATVGPFAHVRSHAVLQEKSVIGNFVEVKNSTIGAQTKAKHLTYLGDAQVGNNVNIGAGTITCNYDGSRKHATIIEDNVFVGSNNTLVAPLIIHKNSFTGAGSTITHAVPEYALALGRSRQVNKEGYMHAKECLLKEVENKSAQNSEGSQEKSKLFVGATNTDVGTSGWYLD